MRHALTLSVLGIAIVAAGCGGDEREWMKLNEKYTREDFKRDWGECSAKGELDEECMKARGWVSVTPPRAEQKKEDPLAPKGGRGGRY